MPKSLLLTSVVAFLAITLALTGCKDFYLDLTQPKRYFVAFDNPPPGLTWKGQEIKHQTVINGDRNAKKENAFLSSDDELMRLHGEVFLLDGVPYPMPRAYVIGYHSETATVLDGEVVVFL